MSETLAKTDASCNINDITVQLFRASWPSLAPANCWWLHLQTTVYINQALGVSWCPTFCIQYEFIRWHRKALWQFCLNSFSDMHIVNWRYKKCCIICLALIRYPYIHIILQTKWSFIIQTQEEPSFWIHRHAAVVCHQKVDETCSYQ